MSPRAKRYEIQSRTFNGLASSGQLDTRSTVVSHVLDFDAVNVGTGLLASSIIPPGLCILNGFQRRLGVDFIVVVAVRSQAQIDRMVGVTIRDEWFAVCERIAFGSHALHAAQRDRIPIAMLRIPLARSALAGVDEM